MSKFSNLKIYRFHAEKSYVEQNSATDLLICCWLSAGYLLLGSHTMLPLAAT
jgi:hypothetical protein